ncbi:MAG: hypothetical protein O7A63_02110 [Acidobacteria bacterium]|nr:hypothetical protein [Acidobacteriota bacterium]
MTQTTPILNGTLLLILVAGLLAGCAGGPGQDAGLEAALRTITADDLAADIRILSSDEFEGRGPSSPGEEKTIAFLKAEFARACLQPGNGESYFQEVPLVAITASPKTELVIGGGTGTSRYEYGGQYMAWTKRVTEKAAIVDSEMIFIGYGSIAPEYDWNDYAGIDVKGKTVVMLVNDPGYATQDESLFNGNAMTYYGRWTYKFEEAARQGAAGAFIVHETKPAAYPWEVVEGSWTGEQFGLVPDDNNMSRAAIEGWFTVDTARAIFNQAGLNYDDLLHRHLEAQ